MSPPQQDPIPFHRPAIGDREIAAAVAVLESGWLTTGSKAHALEDAFVERLGVRHALAVNSATAALHLALDGFDLGPGDEVVVPTNTFTACGEVCAYLGARVVLADVGEDGLLGPAQLEPVVTDATRAVMPVHFAGQAVDVEALRTWRRGHDSSRTRRTPSRPTFAGCRPVAWAMPQPSASTRRRR